MADGQSATGGAAQQTTTTTFDVIESQEILKQLTGNAGRIYRTERRHVIARMLDAVRRWFRLRRNGGDQVS